jgi:hypothetical protein
MTRAGAAGARFRQRKLSTRQALQILREDQVDKLDDDHQRNIPKVDTGVEKGEEIVSLTFLLSHLPLVPTGRSRDISRSTCTLEKKKLI